MYGAFMVAHAGLNDLHGHRQRCAKPTKVNSNHRQPSPPICCTAVDKLAFEYAAFKLKINEIVRKVSRLAEIWRLSLEDQATAIADKSLSPGELLEAAFARIDALDERLNTTVTVMTESARDAAISATKTVQAGRASGSLHGVPIGLKDIFDTAGVLTAGGSRTQETRIPNRDATSVSKLKEAGAIIAAKLTTHEFAHGGPSFDLPWPPARNPWNRDHLPVDHQAVLALQ